MPDYGTKSGSGKGASDKSYTRGSGYTASSSKSGSKASQRRKKNYRNSLMLKKPHMKNNLQ